MSCVTSGPWIATTSYPSTNVFSPSYTPTSQFCYPFTQARLVGQLLFPLPEPPSLRSVSVTFFTSLFLRPGNFNCELCIFISIFLDTSSLLTSLSIAMYFQFKRMNTFLDSIVFHSHNRKLPV